MKKDKLINRLILLAVIIATGVFASFYGGAARSLFYASLFVPVISVIYTLYVYFRFRIYQNAEFKVIVKGEKTPYYFVLTDEDFMSFADVKVTFLEDFSLPQNMELCHSYHLTPMEKIESRTDILCKYRGEYNIGVKDVIVTDFLGLFSIKYPAPSTISMSVLPKIPEIDRLILIPDDNDAKQVRYARSNTEPLDCDLRKYIKGDNLKAVNWKVSAKHNELFSRQSSDTQNSGIVFVMDLSVNNADEYTKLITEDKIIESALASANYLIKKSVPITVLYEQNGIVSSRISSHETFKEFYSGCAELKFTGKYRPEDIYTTAADGTVCSTVIFSVHEVSKELCMLCNKLISLGSDVSLLLVGSDEEHICDILDSRVIFTTAALQDEISDILGGVSVK